MRIKFKHAAVGLAALVLSTGATATAAPATPSGGQTILASVTFFEHWYHGGRSDVFTGNAGECKNLPADWQRTVSSLTTYYRVRLYTAANCWGTEASYPTTTSYVGDAMNDKAVSYRIGG
ncbi:hypothetical protein [Kribbella sp. NPDC023855]|uniref:hypothetical protein n=1 Tax=Kribbella sp. NPDC023855 TaxID=3154698 RepID=UPI003409D3C0